MKSPHTVYARLWRCLGYSWAAAVVALILLFYHWTHVTFTFPALKYPYIAHGGSMYNLSVNGYLAHQLSFVIKPKPELLALPDPYDDKQNAPYAIREASLYKGKYYLYFGPVPALMLYLPFKVFAHIDLGDPTAVFLFGTGCFLVSVLILLRVRKILKNESVFALVLCILAVGLNTFFGHLLRRSQLFEVAIISASFWLMLACYLLVTYFSKGASKARYLVLAGFSLGLAIGCRYSYALCTPMLLLPALYSLREASWRTGKFYQLAIRRSLPGFLSWGFIVGLLFLHNYLRFENPFQFGQKYQLTAVTISRLQLTSLSYIPHNFDYYFLSFIRPDLLFPFFHEAANTPLFDIPAPEHYHAVWNSVGVFNAPFLLMVFPAIAVVLCTRARRMAALRGDALFPLLSLALPAAANIFVLLTFCGIVVRYLLDFTPLLAVLACFSYLFIEVLVRDRPLTVLALRIVAGLLVLYGVAANLGLSMEGEYQAVKRTNPRLFAQTEGRFEFIPRFFFHEKDYGGILLTLRFPPRPEDTKADPLVTTGKGWPSDIVCVSYPAEKTVQFRFYHDLGDAKGVISRPITIDPNREYRVEIQMGSLFPHPLPFLLKRGYDVDQPNILRIKLDGEVVLEGKYAFYDSRPSEVVIGKNETFPIPLYFNPSMFNERFRGSILAAQRLPFLMNAKATP